MEITVSCRHLPMTDSIRAYAMEKVRRLPRFYDRLHAIEVIGDKDDSHHPSAHQVEIIVRAEHAYPFVARASGNELYACIDLAMDKMERQLSAHKERLRNHLHRP